MIATGASGSLEREAEWTVLGWSRIGKWQSEGGSQGSEGMGSVMELNKLARKEGKPTGEGGWTDWKLCQVSWQSESWADERTAGPSMEVLSVKLRCQPWSPSPWSQRPEWPAEVSAELETKEVHSWQWRCRASTSLYLLHHVKFGENVHQQSNLSAGVLLPNPDSSRLRKIEKKKKNPG